MATTDKTIDAVKGIIKTFTLKALPLTRAVLQAAIDDQRIQITAAQQINDYTPESQRTLNELYSGLDALNAFDRMRTAAQPYVQFAQ